MKKSLFSMAIVALIALMPTASFAQFDAMSWETSGYTPATSSARVAIGKVTMINTQNIQLVPKAQMYLLQDLKDPNIFYVAVSLDDSLFKQIIKKGDKVFYAQALEIDKAQTEIILRDYRNKLDKEIADIQKEIDELKIVPEKEKKAEKKARKLALVQKTADLQKAKRAKQSLIDEFKKLISEQAKSTKIYRIFHSEIPNKKVG